MGGVSLEKGAKLMLNKVIPTKLQLELNMIGNRGKNAFGHTKQYMYLFERKEPFLYHGKVSDLQNVFF